MPKRVSDAERIIGYFKSAELPAAKLLLEVVTAEVKFRDPKNSTKQVQSKKRASAASAEEAKQQFDK